MTRRKIFKALLVKNLTFCLFQVHHFRFMIFNFVKHKICRQQQGYSLLKRKYRRNTLPVTHRWCKNNVNSDKTTSQKHDGVDATLLNQVNCVNYMRLASICVRAALSRSSTLILNPPPLTHQSGQPITVYSTAYILNF